MRRQMELWGLLLAALLATTACETPPPQGGSRPYPTPTVRVVFTDQDRAAIQDYYAASYRNLPPGLAKKGKIPPGHAMQIQQGRSVPNGMPWRDLPDDLDRRLSPIPSGYTRVIIGNDVAIVEMSSQRVVDLLEDVLN